MLDSPNTLTGLVYRRRAPALVGLVVLALLHMSAVAHQFEHSADHDLRVCEVCGAYNQLEDAVVASTPGEALVIAPYAAVTKPFATTFQTPLSATYRSRAPPLS